MGTGYAFYTVESQPWVERLTLDLIVEPDGTVTGKATWTLEVFWYGAGSATGEVSGNLIAGEKRGEGEISFNIGGEIVQKDWTLIKVDE